MTTRAKQPKPKDDAKPERKPKADRQLKDLDTDAAKTDKVRGGRPLGRG